MTAAYHHQVIADPIEVIPICLAHYHVADRGSAEFFVEHPITQPLAGLDFVTAVGLTQQEVASFDVNVRLLQQRE